MEFKEQYPARADAASPFTHIGTAPLRVVHMAVRHGLTAEHAAMDAPPVFGESAEESEHQHLRRMPEMMESGK